MLICFNTCLDVFNGVSQSATIFPYTNIKKITIKNMCFGKISFAYNIVFKLIISFQMLFFYLMIIAIKYTNTT